MQELDSTSFAEKNTGNTIIDFWAPWCGPCRQMAPIFEEVSTEFPHITFFKANIEAHPALAEQASVRGIPAIVLYKDGKEVERMIGLRRKQDMVAVITKVYG